MSHFKSKNCYNNIWAIVKFSQASLAREGGLGAEKYRIIIYTEHNSVKKGEYKIMLTSKQRAKLKSIAANIEALYQMGKNEIDENYIIQLITALDAKEVIKIKVHETAAYTPKEAAEILAERTDSEVVQVIGSKIVLYRKSRKKDKADISKMIESLK